MKLSEAVSKLEPRDTVELLLKLVAIVGIIVSFAVSLWQWSDLRSREIKKDGDAKEAERNQQKAEYDRTYAKPIYERQAALYSEAARVTASIATSQDGRQRAKALDRFYELYYGELVTVESPGVSAGMINFLRCYEDQRDCNCNASQDDSEESCQSKAQLPRKQRLENAALIVACTTRRSLRKSWDIPLSALEVAQEDRYCQKFPD